MSRLIVKYKPNETKRRISTSNISQVETSTVAGWFFLVYRETDFILLETICSNQFSQLIMESAKIAGTPIVENIDKNLIPTKAEQLDENRFS